MKKVWAVIGASMAMIVLGLIGAIGAVHDAEQSGYARGRAEVDAQAKVQFQKGMKAGVEYEQWFCANPQYDKSGQ